MEYRPVDREIENGLMDWKMKNRTTERQIENKPMDTKMKNRSIRKRTGLWTGR